MSPSLPAPSIQPYHGWVKNASHAVNDLSEWPTILAVCITLTTLMTAVVALRFYVRGVMIRSIGADDWVILASAGCSIVYNALCITQTRYGLGLPLRLRPKVDVNPYSSANLGGRPFYMAGIMGFKVALCLAYLRIVPRDGKGRFYKHLILVIMIACVIGHVGGIFILLFQCTPVKKSWRPLTKGTCLPNVPVFYALAGVTIFFDLCIFLLPIPLLARVQMKARRKYALIGVFLLGLFTTVCSVMRMIQIIRISKDGNSTGLVLWGTIEMNVGILLTCLPSLTPLAKRIAKSTSQFYYGSRTGGSGGSSSGGKSKDSYRLEKISAPRSANARAGGPVAPHNESEESILRETEDGKVIHHHHTAPEYPSPSQDSLDAATARAGRTDGGITKMTEVDVKVSNASVVSETGNAQMQTRVRGNQNHNHKGSRGQGQNGMGGW